MTENIRPGATPNAFNRKAAGNGNALGPLQKLVVGNHWVGDTGFNCSRTGTLTLIAV